MIMVIEFQVYLETNFAKVIAKNVKCESTSESKRSMLVLMGF